MFKITKTAADRVDIEISGSIDADEMRAALDDLIEKSEDVKEGRMLYTITDFQMPTMGALGVEFTHLPKLFGLLGKFDKCAVLSDTDWIKKVAVVEGALFPGLEIKSYDLEEAKAAEAWLAEGAA